MRTDPHQLSDPTDRTDLPAGGSMLEELLTARQLAELLQMPASTIEDYARRGVLPSLKLGRHRRFVQSDVEQTIAELLSPNGPQRRPTHPRRAQ